MSNMKDHWSGFITALGKTQTPQGSNTIPFENTSTKIGVSGFLDVKPTEHKIEPRYDAMTTQWAGVEASNKATQQNKVGSTDFMPYSK
jgi:hypothetical protein